MSNNNHHHHEDISSSTYLPSNFLKSPTALKTFISLLQESHSQQVSPTQSHKKTMLTHILSNMPGLTDEQKKKTIQAAKELIKNPTQKKSECQF